MGESGLTVNPDDLIGLTDDQIIKMLDWDWPWPFGGVGHWFESLWNSILEWIHSAVDWIADRLAPVWDQIWGWIKSFIDWLWSVIEPAIAVVWDWIKSFIDWLWSVIQPAINVIWGWISSFFNWLWNLIWPAINVIWDWISSFFNWLWNLIAPAISEVWHWLNSFFSWIWGLIEPAIQWIWNELQGVISAVGKVLGDISSWFANNFIDPFLDWLIHFARNFFGVLQEVILDILRPVGEFLRDHILPAVQWIANSAMSFLQPIIAALGDILGSITAIALTIVAPIFMLFGDLLAPVFVSIGEFFERLGPVSPQSGQTVAAGVSAIIAVTLAGLGAMTIAGETLGVWKHFGLGHLSAIIYDVTNYKLLTAAFVGVFAGIYIKTPITYYYNKIARPNLPSEQSLMKLFGQQVITDGEFREGMAYEGYSDQVIDKMIELPNTHLQPRMLNYLAAAGIVDDELIDRELKHAAYDPRTIPYLKTWLQRTASGEVKTLSVSAAMSRYREGFDDETALRQNLTALGVAPMNLDRYVFASQLMQRYDYQRDLAAFYVDAYHRRDIEEPELRRDLATIGISGMRLDLIVWAQSIKRLASPKAAEDPAATVKFDTIRDRRKKQLISREQEVEQLIFLGKEFSYAAAIADNDDVALTASAAKPPAVVLLAYETDEGKISVDTLRRQRRQGSLPASDEMKSLMSLQMPQSLAQAIVNNDALRIRQSASSE